MSRKKYYDTKRFLVKKPTTSRKSQNWKDYTKVKLPHFLKTAPKANQDSPRTIWGPTGAPYVSALGLRKDEHKRVSNVMSRTIFAEGATTKSCEVKTQPPFEYPYFPLHSIGITKPEVVKFWKQKGFDLKLDDRLGNCTFCFMKGDKGLLHISGLKDTSKVENTPSDFNWWVNLEKKYKRRVPAVDGNGTVTFGFFGKRGPTYANIQESGLKLNGARDKRRVPVAQIACDCTD